MRIFVKICGLATPEAVHAAVSAGADAIGFVFAESPRQVSPEFAAELASAAPRSVTRVAVMRHPEPDAWARVRDVFSPDWLQTDADDFGGLDLGTGIMALPVLRDGGNLDPDAADLPERVLFEGEQSGQGLTPDWQMAGRLARRTRLMLAGGLNPNNVRAAIETVGPWGVDVSSGVELAPGAKDPELIAAFVQEARALETEYAD